MIEDSLIVSGGYTEAPPRPYDVYQGYHGDYKLRADPKNHLPVGTVEILKKDGVVEFLPSLTEARARHACASYLNEYGQTVSYTLLYLALVLLLLITGHPRHRRCEVFFFFT